MGARKHLPEITGGALNQHHYICERLTSRKVLSMLRKALGELFHRERNLEKVRVQQFQLPSHQPRPRFYLRGELTCSCTTFICFRSFFFALFEMTVSSPGFATATASVSFIASAAEKHFCRLCLMLSVGY